MPNVTVFRVTSNKKKSNKNFLFILIPIIALAIFANIMIFSNMDYFDFKYIKAQHLKSMLKFAVPIISIQEEGELQKYATDYLNIKSMLIGFYPILAFHDESQIAVLPSEDNVEMPEGEAETEAEHTTTETEEGEKPNVLNTPTNKLVYEGINIRNHTKYKIDIEKLLNQPLGVKLNKKATQVIIFHTHTSEAYTDNTQKREELYRTDDPKYNIVRVGAELKTYLFKYGVNSYHDKRINDASYTGSYQRSLTGVLADMAKYPSAQIVLDIHRDAVSGSPLRVAQNIDGKDVAKIMFVVGTNDMGLYHPKWQDNLRFALKLQQKANELYPGLCREIDLRQERFNQHVSSNALIVEVGGNGNTLQEATASMALLAKVIAEVIKN